MDNTKIVLPQVVIDRFHYLCNHKLGDSFIFSPKN